MKPKGEVVDERTTVELNTGVYRVNEWGWMEFRIDYDVTEAAPDALDQIIAKIAPNAIEKYRETGTEMDYLGYQTERVDDQLEGCLVFAKKGDYEQVSKPVTVEV